MNSLTQTTIFTLSALFTLGLAGCGDSSVADAAGPDLHGTPGVNQAGSQDFGGFREVLSQGEIPAPELLDDVGFFAEHKIPLPPPECAQNVCLHAKLGVMGNFVTGANCTMLFIGLNTPLDPSAEERKPLNLAIALDTSGSMRGQPLAEVQAALRLMLPELKANDRISLVSFGDAAELTVARAAPGSALLSQAIDELTATGATNIYAGLRTAYELVHASQSADTQNRVVLLTDGEATAGFTAKERLVKLSAGYAEEGISLSTVGFGKDFDLPLMKELSLAGSGSFYFAEHPAAVREVFVEEVQSFLVPIALHGQIYMHASEGYNVRAVYGAHDASTTLDQAWINLPLLQTAHRTNVADNVQGRRGGGGVLIVELTPKQELPEPVPIGGLSFKFQSPEGERFEQRLELESPLAPGETPEQGYFSAEGVEKSFVMLNLFAGMKLALEDVRFGDPLGAAATLESLEAAVTDWNKAHDDPDIQSDLTTLRQLLKLVEARADEQATGVNVAPRGPWND